MKSKGIRTNVMFENAHQKDARSAVPHKSVRTARRGRLRYAITPADSAAIPMIPVAKIVGSLILFFSLDHLKILRMKSEPSQKSDCAESDCVEHSVDPLHV